jgi:hypothetical protein
VRQDAWAQLNRIEAEQKKTTGERGKYLHPELFGKKAVGIHPAPATRFDEVVPDGLREWAADLSADLATPAAKVTGKLNAARRLLHKTMAFDRSRIDRRAGAVPGMPPPKPSANVATRVEAARRWLEDRGAAGRAKLDAQWREVEQTVEAMRR